MPELCKDGWPAKGMRFEQARSRLMKYESVMNNAYLVESLVQQFRECEGEKAANSLNEEFTRTRLLNQRSKDCNNHSSNRLGASPLYAKNYDSIKWCNK